jgi:hypothetical protein
MQPLKFFHLACLDREVLVPSQDQGDIYKRRRHPNNLDGWKAIFKSREGGLSRHTGEWGFQDRCLLYSVDLEAFLSVNA